MKTGERLNRLKSHIEFLMVFGCPVKIFACAVPELREESGKNRLPGRDPDFRIFPGSGFPEKFCFQEQLSRQSGKNLTFIQ